MDLLNASTPISLTEPGIVIEEDYSIAKCAFADVCDGICIEQNIVLTSKMFLFRWM